MADTQYIGAGKPKTAGSIYSAAFGSTLPTDATTEMSTITAFSSLGYVSDDGFSITNSPDTDTAKAWGGDTVAVINNGSSDEVKVKLIEATNILVLKEVFGQDNVSGTLAAGITVKANSDDRDSRSYVVDMIIGTTVKRVVIPKAQLKEVSEVSYKDSEIIGYEITLQALPDTSGNTHYEYLITAS